MEVKNFYPQSNGGHGIHVYGSDAQGGTFVGGGLSGNWGWGIYDESLDGNKYDAFIGQGNRGHQDLFSSNRDYTNPTGNTTIFDGNYTEAAINLIMGAGEANGLLANDAVDPESTGFTFGAGVARNRPLTYLNKRGVRGVSSSIGGDAAGTRMIALSFSTLDDAYIDPQSTHFLEYNDTTKVWSLLTGAYDRYFHLATPQASAREPSLWLENGVFLGRDDASGTPILFTAETTPRAVKYNGAAKTYQRGDTVWQSQPVIGGRLGKVCTTGAVWGSGQVFADLPICEGPSTTYSANQALALADRFVSVTVTGTTMTLPASPFDGQCHAIKSTALVTTTVDTSGGTLNIDGVTTATVLPGINTTFRYSAVAGEWEAR